MRSPTILLSCGLGGCASPEAAPAELEAVAQSLFRDFEDPEALPDLLEELTRLLADTELEGSDEVRSRTLTPLTLEDVGETALEGLDPSDCIAVSLTYQSAWSPMDHSSYQVLEDLSVLGTASSYARSFLEPADPACFPEQQCELLRTDNDILRENLLLSLDYTMRKDYRWVEIDAGMVMVERGWLSESAHGASGNNHLWQSFELEVWLPSSAGAVRFFVSYADAEYAGVSDDLGASLTLSGAQSAMEAADAYLDAERTAGE